MTEHTSTQDDSVDANRNIGGDYIHGDRIDGDKIQGDQINVDTISDKATVAVGRNASVHIGDIYHSDIESHLANYISNKQTEWEKPETTTHHIHLTAKSSHDSLREEIERFNKNKKMSLWTAISDIEQTLDEFNGCFVLLGEPGSGKSTLLRKLAHQATIHYKKKTDIHLPVLIDLSQWPDSVEFEVFLKKRLHQETEYQMPVPYGELFLFLDGLNEMSGDVKAKARSLDVFLQNQNVWVKSEQGLQVIISCRYHAYTEGLSLDLPRVVIEPLSKMQITGYLQTRKAESLIIFLFGENRDGQLGTLAKRPFFLKILSDLYENDDFQLNSSIYQNRGLILDEYVQGLWRREKNSEIHHYITDVPDFFDIKSMLMQLAFDIQVRDAGTTISAELAVQSFLKKLDTLPKILKPLKKISQQITGIQQKAEFFLRVCENANILHISQDGTTVQFQHELLQEYFTAHYLYMKWKPNSASKDSRNKIYRYLENTLLSFDKRHREQQHWDEVWFTFAHLCNVIELDDFIREVSDIKPFFAAEIASRTNTNPECLEPLIAKLIQYVTTGKQRKEVALYTLGNFSPTKAIIKAIVSSMDEYNLYQVTRFVLWQIGERIGIPLLLKHMDGISTEDDNAIWGLFIHENPADDYYFNFEFFKLEWLFDKELYDRYFADKVRTNYVTQAYVADVQNVIDLIKRLPPVSSGAVLPYIPDRVILDACLFILPDTPTPERIVSIILRHSTLTSDDILYLLQQEREDVRDIAIMRILVSQHERTPVKQDILNQFDIAFYLVQLWHSLAKEHQGWDWDKKRKPPRQMLESIEPAYVLPALSKFLQQADISTKEIEEVFDLIQKSVKTHPYNYDYRYKWIGGWLLDILTDTPSRKERMHVLAARTLSVLKPPAALPIFIELASQNWTACINALAEMELGEYTDKAKEALLLALEKYEDDYAAQALGKLQVSEATPTLINLNKKIIENMSSEKWMRSNHQMLVTLSQLEGNQIEIIEIAKKTLENVPLTHDYEAIQALNSAIQVLKSYTSDPTIIIALTDLLNRFCVGVGKDGQYSYIRWGPHYERKLADEISEVITLLEPHHFDSRICKILINIMAMLYDIIQYRDQKRFPTLNIDKILIVVIQVLGKKKVETAVPLLRNILNNPALTYMNVWKAVILALGQIDTKSAITALCDVFKNRESVYPEWEHDILSELATKTIVNLEKKFAFDLFFDSLLEIRLYSSDNISWLESHVGKEVRTIKSEKALEYLIQAWIDVHSSELQDFIADKYLAYMPKCIPFVIQHAIPHSQYEVRRNALNILNKFETGQAVDGIYILCNDERMEIRQLATWILGNMEDVRAISGLAKIIQHPPQMDDEEEWNKFMWWIRPMTDGYMLRYSSEYSTTLSVFLSKKSIRKVATTLLIDIESPKVLEILESLSNNRDSSVRYWGKYGLNKIEEKRKQAPYSIPSLLRLSDK